MGSNPGSLECSWRRLTPGGSKLALRCVASTIKRGRAVMDAPDA